ncbi:cytochrome P450 [Xylaria arbuscula]|nr:cytochrome P450 [Xylaria arbuscula]
MIEQVDLFVDILSASSRKSEPVNITDLVTHLACDLVVLLSLGFALKLQSESTNRFMISGMFRANQLPRYKKILETMIKSRLSDDKGIREDLFSIMTSAMDRGENIQLSDIWTEAISFFPAGALPILAATSAVYFYLAHNRHCYERLAYEIRETFALNRDIKGGPQLANCRYLEQLAADEKGKPLIIDGHVIPPGTQLGVNIFALHHNEKYFPNPYEFIPERTLMHQVFAPFSVGYGSCAGKSVTYLEASLIIAKTLWNFHLYDVISGQHDGPYLIFTSRGKGL